MDEEIYWFLLGWQAGFDAESYNQNLNTYHRLKAIDEQRDDPIPIEYIR